MDYTPAQPAHWDFTSERWPLDAYALYLLAHHPWAARIEYENALGAAYGYKPNTDFIQNTFRLDLPSRKLIEARTMYYVSRFRFTFIRLTEKGRDYCRELGWEPCENEWDALQERHSALEQPKHTAAVLAFAMAARARGWQTEALPTIPKTYLFPDLLLHSPGGYKLYVEVELGNRKHAKWRNYDRHLGIVGICTKTERGRARLVKECKAIGLRGFATDLLYLARTHNPAAPLWRQTWNENGEDLVAGTELENGDEYGNY